MITQAFGVGTGGLGGLGGGGVLAGGAGGAGGEGIGTLKGQSAEMATSAAMALWSAARVVLAAGAKGCCPS